MFDVLEGVSAPSTFHNFYTKFPVFSNPNWHFPKNLTPPISTIHILTVKSKFHDYFIFI